MKTPWTTLVDLRRTREQQAQAELRRVRAVRDSAEAAASQAHARCLALADERAALMARSGAGLSGASLDMARWRRARLHDQSLRIAQDRLALDRVRAQLALTQADAELQRALRHCRQRMTESMRAAEALAQCKRRLAAEREQREELAAEEIPLPHVPVATARAREGR